MKPMNDPQRGHGGPELQPLADLDQIIHAQARLMILTYLYVVDSVDYVFMLRLTGMSWGKLASHLSKLEQAGYIDIEKTYQGKKPKSILRMTERGRAAFKAYKDSLQEVLDSLPD
jgi:DNA-binding MarR family transcriptional regulator